MHEISMISKQHKSMTFWEDNKHRDKYTDLLIFELIVNETFICLV